MILAIFGASGRTGQFLVEQALEKGYAVTALARNPGKLSNKGINLTVIRGNVLEPESVDRVIAGSDAVISVLGPTGNQPTFEVSQGMVNILAAMKKNHVRRLVISTGAGVRDPNDQPGLFDKAMGVLLNTVARNVYEDMKRTVDLVRSSDTDWTVVRTPMLTDITAYGQVRVGYLGKGVGPRISRADMAGFILDQVKSDTYLRKAPVISN